MNNSFFPPFRFATVQDNLYRGALPKPRNLSFLKTLNLTRIISCIPDSAPDYLKEFCAANGISLIFLKTEKPKEHIPLSFPKVIQILSLLTDPSQTIYLHCLDGVLVTCMIVMGLRKLQGWTFDAYVNEACRFLRDGILSVEESEFIKKLTGEFEVGHSLPKWLWGGVPLSKHVSFKIKTTSVKLVPQYDSPLLESGMMTMLELEKEDLRRYASKRESLVMNEEDEVNEGEDVSRTLEALDLEVSNRNG